MSDNSSKNFHLWKEVKRRNVLRSLAIYAGTAFIILEATTILFPRWDLPDRSIDLVFWLLVLGAVINVFIAWFFDMTPQGMQKTKAVEEVTESEPRAESKAWRVATYLSLVVIIGLIILNIVRNPNSLHAGDIQSLVILPFENYTGDDQLENMVAGMHSMLIGDMGRISHLRVIGKTSSRLYKEVDMTAGAIASELNVDAVVESTVMCLGDTICMQFRLVSTTGEEEQLWVGEYREDKGQILNMYNKVTKQIAQEVHIELTDSEKQSFEKDREVDRDAIDDFILSHAFWGDLSSEGFDKAEEYLLLALEKDPEWSSIYATLAMVWVGRMQMGMVNTETGRRQIEKNIERARDLDPDYVDSHFINGIIYSWPEWEWEKGEKELRRAITLDPNHIMARMYYAHLLMILQRMDEALAQGKLAVEQDPKNPLILSLYSVVLKGAKQPKAVLNHVEQALAIDPDHAFTKGQLGRAHYDLGDYEKDLEIQKASLLKRLDEEMIPNLVSIFREKGRQAAYREVAGLWELYYEGQAKHPILMARKYYRANEFEKALDYLEIGYHQHNPNLPYIGTGTRFEALHDSTRFLAILDSMNLPYPKYPKNP